MSLLRNSVRKPAGHQEELQTNMVETILDFQQETMKALWHAFHMLDMSNSGSVHVSQLKVITATIGSKMAFTKAEEILNKEENVVSMDFSTYFEIIKTELIDKQKKVENEEAFLGSRLNSIVKTCWTFCNFERNHHCKSFTTEHCVVLWRLYNFLSETTEDGEPALPVLLHPAEAALLLRDFIDITGQKNKETQVKEFLTEKQDALLTFTEFLNVFEKDYVTSLSNKNITIGLNHLYDTYILNILKKGKMRKRGFKVKTWKDRWLVLTPTHLNYYVSSDEKVPADRPAHKPNRFVINTPKKPYDMSAFDLRSKNEWVSAIELALGRVGKDPNIQKEAAHERCKERIEKHRLAAEDERRRQEDADLLRSRESELDEQKKKRLEDEELLRARLHELEEERKRREQAEARWLEEQALREEEQQRLKELEEIKRELERLLAEERQAKRDEEIVRNLQSKLLEEEFEKREELERLKQQQEDMLRAEREQKAVLESDRKDQERLLAEAQERLEQLERDKAAAAEKMQEAADKLQRAEKDRHIMEEKVKLWKTPVGLARPIKPHANPLVTHRGLGAFCKHDFVKTQTSVETEAVGSADHEVPKEKEAEKKDFQKSNDETDNSDETVSEVVETNDDFRTDQNNSNVVAEKDNVDKEDNNESEITEKGGGLDKTHETAETNNNVTEEYKDEIEDQDDQTNEPNREEVLNTECKDSEDNNLVNGSKTEASEMASDEPVVENEEFQRTEKTLNILDGEDLKPTISEVENESVVVETTEENPVDIS